MDGELDEKTLQLVLPAKELNALGKFECGLQQAGDQPLRNRSSVADHEFDRAARVASLPRAGQFPPEQEDLLRVAVRDSSGFGQHQLPAGPCKE